MPKKRTLKEKNVELGKRIRKAVDLSGKNQKELAPLIGVYPSNISRWIKGENAPSWECLVKIATFGNVSLDWLLTGKESKQPQETFLTEQEERLLKMFGGLSPNDRDFIVGKALEREEQEQQRGAAKKALGGQEKTAA